MKSSKKLHLGCGIDIKKDYINVDIVKNKGVDKVIDLNKYPWPFKEDQFNEIIINHTLEHLDDVIKALNEMWRITKKGGKIEISVPYFASALTFRDLTHKHVFTYTSFDNWDIKNFKKGIYVTHMNKKMRFKIEKRRINFFGKNRGIISIITNILTIIPDFLINLAPKIYERFFFFYFPATSIEYILEVVK